MADAGRLRNGQGTVVGGAVEVARVVKAATATEVVEVVRTAAEAGESLLAFGGGHSAGTGHPWQRPDIGLDMRPLAGILAYEPEDLVLSVRAGTSVAEIQETLRANNQELPVDVPFPRTATIGGVVATGYAGPRRLRSGSLRDLLIGCEFVRGDGLLAKAGGMVVKNVSGFELPRFLHGSWGALALLTTVNLKITPRPRADGTFLARMEGLPASVEAALDLTVRQPSLDACTVVVGTDGITLAARSMGRERAVTATLTEAEGVLAGGSTLTGDESAAWWQAIIERFTEDPGRVVLAIATRPRDVATLAATLASSLDGAETEWEISPAIGSLRVRLDGDGARADHLERLATAIAQAGGSWVLESAPARLQAAIPVWGEEPEGIAVMRAIKQQFDPAGILNRGRTIV